VIPLGPDPRGTLWLRCSGHGSDSQPGRPGAGRMESGSSATPGLRRVAIPTSRSIYCTKVPWASRRRFLTLNGEIGARKVRICGKCGSGGFFLSQGSSQPDPVHRPLDLRWSPRLPARGLTAIGVQTVGNRLQRQPGFGLLPDSQQAASNFGRLRRFSLHRLG
jgi:hypothetical protein